jgi:GntR family transcriptional regulator
MNDEDIEGLKPNADDPTPLYMQVAKSIRGLIESDRWTDEQALPSERQLVDGLGISRVTARKALEQVANWGLVVRRQGSGTFVAPRLEQPLSRLTSFSEELKLRGIASGSTWLSRDVAQANPEEMLALNLGSGAKVARLKRLRTADEAIMAIEYSRLPYRYLANPEQIGSSLYQYLDAAGTPVLRALQRISAVNATKEQASLLHITPGAALLFITRKGFGADDAIIEYTHSYCIPTVYEFVAELRRTV